MFIVDELHRFRPRLPEESTKEKRVDAYLDFLTNQEAGNRQPLLLTFFSVLLSRYDTDDMFFYEVNQLQEEIREFLSHTNSDPERHTSEQLQRIDWGDAINPSVFYGRNIELEDFERWVIDEKCRLITVLGMGGIGKSSLVLKFLENAQNDFQHIFWRDLKNAPPIDSIIDDCIKFISDQSQIDLPENTDTKIMLLVDLLRKKRCLLVLDNAETILQHGKKTRDFKEGYESYEKLIQQIATNNHKSCLIVTSREEPSILGLLKGKSSPIHLQYLGGLDRDAAVDLLSEREISGNDVSWSRLIELYGSNPLALKLCSAAIEEWFEGDIERFLKDDLAVFGDLEVLLDQQFYRLTETGKGILFWLAITRETISLTKLEKEIVYWLTIGRTEMTLEGFQDEIIRPLSKKDLLEALDNLIKRSLIEKNESQYALQPVVMEHLTKLFVNKIISEVATENPDLFRSHAIMQAQAKEYIRQSQLRFMLRPISDELILRFGQNGLIVKLKNIIEKLKGRPKIAQGYAAGNVINILSDLNYPLNAFDFSGMSVWQAYLPSINLQGVNFSDADLSKSVFAETFDIINSVIISPNGELLAAGAAGGKILIWSTYDYQQIFSLTGHTGWIRSVCFSPDSQLLASGSGDQTIRLWNVNSGECVKVLKGHTDWVRSVAFHPNGKMLASSGSDRTIRLWDIQTGEQLNTLHGHQDWVWSISFNSDGTSLVSGSNDKTVKIWDITTGSLIRTLDEHSDWIRTVAFSPDGKMVASGCNDGFVRLWDVTSGILLKTLTGHSNKLWCVKFSSNGKFLSSCSNDQTIRVWDVDTGYCLKTLQGHIGRIVSIAFSPDDKVLVSGSEDQTVRLWDTQTGECIKTFTGKTNSILAISVSTDGKLLASASTDQTVRLWDYESGDCISNLLGHTNRVDSVAISPDKKLIASCSDDLTIRLWNTMRPHSPRILRGHTSWVIHVNFNNDGSLLASSSDDLSVRIWDVSNGNCIKILKGHTSWVTASAFNNNGTILATASADKSIIFWDTKNFEVQTKLLGHEARINSLMFSRDSKKLATCCDDKTIKIWDVINGSLLKTLIGHKAPVRSVAFSNDDLLASGADDYSINLWNIFDGNCIGTLHGHANKIWSLTFNPVDNSLISAGEDGLIKIWDVVNKICARTLMPKRIYEGMIINGVSGITSVQKETLLALGAINDLDSR
jgi:WD40 repeat protein